MSLAIRKYLRPAEIPKHIRDFSDIAPLLAAVFAPFSVLLDIPGLSERWYSKGGIAQPDPTANLVLSALSLAFSTIANVFLVFRFSLEGNRWKHAVTISVVFWFIKLVIATANLIVFGAYTRNDDGFEYQSGFWCAVVSNVLSGIIFLLLTIHFIDEFFWRQKHPEKPSIRVHGRHFMLQETLFVTEIAVVAIIFSKIEGWSYLDGIYFIMVTFLTIGYGDYSPSTTAGRIILFPIALLGIAMLGSLIQMIVTFFSQRAANRKAESRFRFERQRQIEEDKCHNPADLGKEIEFLTRLNEHQDMWDQLTEFIMSCLGFFIFWVIGAAIFMALEGWSYGTSMYFLYVTFLTIGYGDFGPQTPAGRVVFLIYALLSVPVMASFAVQAITQVITRISIWRLERRKAETGVDETTAKSNEPPVSHSQFVERHSQRWDNKRQGVSGDAGESEREALLEEVLHQAVEMEAHARRLLVSNLPNGSKGQVILKADRNVQMRNIQETRRRMQNDTEVRGSREHQGNTNNQHCEIDVSGGTDDVARPLTNHEMLDEVNKYRECFAALLAAGSRLKSLNGLDKLLIERRTIRVEGEGWDKQRSMQSEKEAADKTL